MAEPETTSSNKLFTLSEISQKTGISMPTLQRYKKLYQSRIPSAGKGRKQRYPEESLPVFEELKVENAGRRGRPRKDDSTRSSAGAANAASTANIASTASARSGRGRKATPAKTPAAARRGGRKAAAPAPAAAAKKTGRGGRKAAAAAPAASGRGGRSSGLMTLTQISEQTGISYPTLVRYVRVHSNRLPSEGAGRARRFHPEAVDVFRQLRGESGRGGRKPSAANAAKSAKAAKATGRGRAASGSARVGRPSAAAASNTANTAGSDPGTTKRLRALERAQQDLEKRFLGFVTSLQKLFR